VKGSHRIAGRLRENCRRDKGEGQEKNGKQLGVLLKRRRVGGGKGLAQDFSGPSVRFPEDNLNNRGEKKKGVSAAGGVTGKGNRKTEGGNKKN